VKRACPTIQELLALDAIARHQSLTRASSALCVSVSAVSKQIGSLEDFLGRPLLQKIGRGVELTPVGREYLAKISPGLRAIETATYEVRAGSAGAGVIALASVPTFLTKWLIPRLVDFRRLHSGVTFSFSQHLGHSDPLPSDVDAAIRYGDGDWHGMRSDYIAGNDYVCVLSPGLRHSMGLAESAADVISQTLLHHEQAPLAWRHWSLQNKIDESSTLSGPRFAQYSAIIQASLSGLGISLVPRVLVEEELEVGKLVTVGVPVSLEQGHYLCFDDSRLERPIFAAFRSWMLAQSGAKRDSTGP
jgi:LysR family transcriptional regulator, glycine cleavage system transcriptional activator